VCAADDDNQLMRTEMTGLRLAVSEEKDSLQKCCNDLRDQLSTVEADKSDLSHAMHDTQRHISGTPAVIIVIIVIIIIIIIIVIIISKLSTQSGDDRETSFLFQRLSVLIQHFNAILLLDSFVKEEEE